MPKNVQTTIQLHSIHVLARLCSKSFKLGRLQQYINQKLPDVTAGLRKVRGARDKIVNICWIIEKAGEFQEKNIYFCFIDYIKAFDYVDHNKLWKILKEIEVSDHFTCFLWSLYESQEATVRTGHETMDWLKIRKGVHQGHILEPCLFNLYGEYIMWSARLDESQDRSKIVRRNINNLIFWDDHFNGGKQRGAKNLLTRVKEENEKAGLKLNIQKIKIMASSPIASWQIDGGKVETVRNVCSLEAKLWPT